jgi:hypothetical protein
VTWFPEFHYRAAEPQPGAQELAAALEAALRPHLPAAAELERHGAVLVLRERGTPFGSLHDLGDHDLGAEEGVWNATYFALEQLQTELAELSTDPWPGHGGDLPPLEVRVTGRRVEAWFGDEGEPVLALAPIELPTP